MAAPSLERVLLTAQQLHVLSDSVVPGYIWAGCAQSKTRRHLRCSCWNYYPNCLEDLVIYSPLVPVLSPVHAVITVSHLVGCHTLDVAKVSGPLHDDVSLTSRSPALESRVPISSPGIEFALPFQPCIEG